MMHSVLANASGMKEFLEYTIKEIHNDKLKLHIRALDGMEIFGDLPISDIKEQDRKHIKLSGTIHITVYKTFTNIHLLRTK